MTWRLGVMVVAVLIVLVTMILMLVQIVIGFTVSDGAGGTIEIVQGEPFLWFEPTLEVESAIMVAELPPLERELVEVGQESASREEAETYLAYLESVARSGP